MPSTQYTCTFVNGVPVVTTPAEIDITTADEFRAVLHDAASGDRQVVVVNMMNATFCDSSGLHALLGAHRRATSAGRELRLAMPPGSPVTRIFTLTGVDGVLVCFPSIEEAWPSDSSLSNGHPGPVPRLT